jgi:GntR family transcriptional regulator
VRVIQYQSIAEDLRRRLGEGEFSGSGVLPSEAALSSSYGVSRVTVRRALEALRSDGLVESRQGFGWLVATEPLRQDLSRLATLDRQLAAAGVRSERRILSFGFVAPPSRIAEVLGSRSALEVRRLNLADGQPFAVVTVWCPEDLGAGLSRDDVARASFLEQLPVAVGGATQTIGAAVAGADDAALLGVPVGAPVLVAERTTRSTSGRVVLVSEHVFPAHRTRFVVELGVDDGSPDPAGLRLLD